MSQLPLFSSSVSLTANHDSRHTVLSAGLRLLQIIATITTFESKKTSHKFQDFSTKGFIVLQHLNCPAIAHMRHRSESRVTQPKG